MGFIPVEQVNLMKRSSYIYMEMDLDKNLEQLENSYWGDADEAASRLIKRSHKLRKKKLKDLSVEDLRLLIRQNIGLEYLIPLAIDTLRDTPFAEGDLYEGDLLESVLKSDKDYWKRHSALQNEVESIFLNSKQQLKYELDVTNEIKEGLINSFAEFQRS